MKKTTAYIRNCTFGTFSLTIPSFFTTLTRLEREDVVEYFRENGGTFNDLLKAWVFPSACLAKMPGILSTFSISLVSQLGQSVAQKAVIETVPARLIVEPKKTLVQVPASLVIKPTDPAVQRILESAYSRLEQEFFKLHMETGVCKTKMREILSRAVPAVESPLFSKNG